MIPDLNVRSLAARNLFEGSLDFEYEAEADLLDLPYVAFSSPVHAKLHYDISEDGAVEVVGSVAFSLKGACSRCLEPAEGRFEGQVEGVFLEGDGDGDAYGYRRGVVKLGELLRDSVLFALPPRLLCGNCSENDGD